MEYIEQHLHGNYFKNVGDFVRRGEAIGYAYNNGTQFAHDHVSIAEFDGYNHTNNGWYGPVPNNLINPYNVGVSITGNPDDKFVFDPANGLGGYGFLEQTSYNWYTGPNKTLHDGLDLWATIGQYVYALNDGYITDVGIMNGGCTYIYIK